MRGAPGLPKAAVRHFAIPLFVHAQGRRFFF